MREPLIHAAGAAIVVLAMLALLGTRGCVWEFHFQSQPSAATTKGP